MAVLDIFTYVFKPKDEGVEKKLGDIEKKSKDAKAGVDGVSQSFTEFGQEARSAVEAIIPGADKLIDNLKKIGEAVKRARNTAHTTAKKPTSPAEGGGGSGTPKPPVSPSAPSGGAAAEAEGVATALGGLTIVLGVAAVAVGVMVKAFVEGTEQLTESRKKAQEAGINSVQMAAGEQWAKSLRLSKNDFQSMIVQLGNKTREGWVTSKTFGNIFGIGNETTQLLRTKGISVSDRGGRLRNSAAIFDDITKKMQNMSREAAIGFGQFFGMSKDMATAIKDSGQTFSQYAAQHREEIEQQAKAIDQARAYEKAQQGLSNAWDDFRIRVGGKLLPFVTEMVEDLTTAADSIGDLGGAIAAFWRDVKDIANQIVDWVGEHTPEAVKKGASAVGNAFDMVWEDMKGTVRDTVDYWKGEQKSYDHEKDLNQAAADIKASTGKDATRAEAEKKLADDQTRERADYMKKMNQQTSDNAMAAKTQLEAANAMKVATNRFGLTTEQYFAMWAAKSGREGGLRASGGVTPEDFKTIYGESRKYAPNAEWATALYGRGAPMMAQLPNQYVQGMGYSPFWGPQNAKGLTNLKNAQQAVNDTNFAIPQKATQQARPIEVNTGPITIQTSSTDPNEVGNKLSQNLSDQIKYAVSKISDAQVA